MHINNLKIELAPRFDKDEEVYYIGRLKFPGSIDCSNGVTFLIFLSESGLEELQIAVNDKDHVNFNRLIKKPDRLKIKLDSREDKDNNKFYIAKIMFNGYIKCNPELCFLVFKSKKGNEELQITGKFHYKKRAGKPVIEVIRR